jgi:hypothetical protein
MPNRAMLRRMIVNELPHQKARRTIKRLERAGEPVPGSLYIKAKMKLPEPVTVARVDWTPAAEAVPMGTGIPVIELFGHRFDLCSKWTWNHILNRGEK